MDEFFKWNLNNEIKVSRKVFFVFFVFLNYSLSFSALIDDNVDPIVDIYTSDLDATRIYQVYHYRFATDVTINAYIAQTPHFTNASYLAVANDIIGATTINFVPDPVFNGSYRNTVIFSEMDTGEDFYTAMSIAFNNDLEECTQFETVTVDPDGTTITGITAGPLAGGGASLTANCTDDVVDSGLIVFNTHDWNLIFDPDGASRGDGIWDPVAELWVPPADVQSHWILHEFSHLLGLGHILDPDVDLFNQVGVQGDCRSVMVGNIVNPAITPDCTNDAPNTYWLHDSNVLTQIGYF